MLQNRLLVLQTASSIAADQRVSFQLSQQHLIKDQHRSALDTGPYESGSDASEASSETFRLIDHFQTSKHRGCVKRDSALFRKRRSR